MDELQEQVPEQHEDEEQLDEKKLWSAPSLTVLSIAAHTQGGARSYLSETVSYFVQS